MSRALPSIASHLDSQANPQLACDMHNCQEIDFSAMRRGVGIENIEDLTHKREVFTGVSFPPRKIVSVPEKVCLQGSNSQVSPSTLYGGDMIFSL